MPFSESPLCLSLDFFAFIRSLPRSLPRNNLNGPFKMEIDHFTPLLKHSQGSLNISKQHRLYMIWPPLVHPHFLLLSSLSPCSHHTGFFALSSMHQGDLGLNCPLCLGNSFPQNPPGWLTTLQEFCSDLSSHPGQSWLPIHCYNPTSSTSALPHSPCSTSTDIADNKHQFPSTGSLGPERSESVSFLIHWCVPSI